MGQSEGQETKLFQNFPVLFAGYFGGWVGRKTPPTHPTDSLNGNLKTPWVVGEEVLSHPSGWGGGTTTSQFFSFSGVRILSAKIFFWQ